MTRITSETIQNNGVEKESSNLSKLYLAGKNNMKNKNKTSKNWLKLLVIKLGFYNEIITEEASWVHNNND